MESSLPLIASVALFFIVSIIIFVFLKPFRQKDDHLKSRISRFQEDKKSAKVSQESIILAEKERLGRSRGGRLKRVNNLETWLRHTGVKWLSVSRFIMISLIANVTISYIIYRFFTVPEMASIVAGAFISFFLSIIVIKGLIARRKAKFLEVFPDAMDLIRRALKTGYTPDRAIAMAAQESASPVKEAFTAVVNRTGLGEPLDKALQDIVNEIGVEEFRMLAIVLVLQRDTGGSLSDVIDNFSKIMRERLRLKKKIKAITAEGKASGYMVSAIPFVIIGVLQFLVPGYMDPLFNSSSGHTALMIGGGLMFSGLFIIYRMVSKDYY